jgi:hypothetical protein
MSIVISLPKRSGQSSPISINQWDETMVAIEQAFLNVGAGSGTVTSVGVSAPASIFAVSSSPITTFGTIGLTLNVQSANRIWAGPTTGADATPTFRSLVIADIPTITPAKGGTGNTGFTSGRLIVSTSTDVLGVSTVTATEAGYLSGVTSAIQTQLDSKQSTITVLPISNGGTGASSAQSARLGLLPSVAGNAGKFLRVNAGETDVEWATITGAIPTINSLSGALTIAPGSSGTDFAIASAGTTITINIPSASATNRGLITTAAQTIAGVKTFTSAPVVNPSTPAQVFYSGSTREVAGSNDFTYDELNLKVGNVRQTSWSRVATSSTLEAATQSGILLDIGAAINLTLPTLDADIIGHKFVIKDMNGSCGTDHVTIRVQTGEILENTVNGTYLMNKAYECVSVVAIDEGSSNFRWIILSEFS